MSKANTPPETTGIEGLDLSDAEAAVEEHRELIEKIAAADVALSERCQAVLDTVDGDETDD